MASPFDRPGSCKIFRSSCSRRQTGGGAGGVRVRRRPGGWVGVFPDGRSLGFDSFWWLLTVQDPGATGLCTSYKKALLLSTDCFQERVAGSNDAKARFSLPSSSKQLSSYPLRPGPP